MFVGFLAPLHAALLVAARPVPPPQGAADKFHHEPLGIPRSRGLRQSLGAVATWEKMKNGRRPFGQRPFSVSSTQPLSFAWTRRLRRHRDVPVHVQKVAVNLNPPP